MAEREGFEPPVPFQVQRFSRPPVSTTHTSLRAGGYFHYKLTPIDKKSLVVHFRSVSAPHFSAPVFAAVTAALPGWAGLSESCRGAASQLHRSHLQSRRDMENTSAPDRAKHSHKRSGPVSNRASPCNRGSRNRRARRDRRSCATGSGL